MRSCAQLHQLWTRLITQRLQPRLLTSHHRTIKTIAAIAAAPILCYRHPINTSISTSSFPTSRTGYHLIHRNTMSTEHEAKKTDPHTVFPKPFVYGKVEIHPVALFGDNYSYVILDTSDNSAILVDPADPFAILHELRTRFDQYTVTHILTTHKHWDHAGGNQKIKEHLHEIQVVGGINDSVPAVTMPVKHGDSLKLSGNINVSVIEAPCHTSGHVLYYVNQKFLFTGDTLFIGGCGRFFEGDAAQMYDNFYNKIGKLPDDTDLYVGHEYTVANLEFALWIEPDNEALKQKYRWAQSQREKKYPTIPSTIGDEKQINPFMRVTQPSVISRITKLGFDASTPIQVMHHLRQLKNENAHQKK